MNKIDLKKLINKAISNEGFLSMPSFLMNDILTSIVDCITEYKTGLPNDSTDNPNNVYIPVDVNLEILSRPLGTITMGGEFILSFKTNYKWKIFTTNSEWLTVDKSEGNSDGINKETTYEIKYSLAALRHDFVGSREAAIIIVSGDKYAVFNIKQVSDNTIFVPTSSSIIGSYTQRWGIKTLQTYGPDNWGTDAVISELDGETFRISPIFGSLGFNDGGLLKKVNFNSNLYRLDGGTHNLLGTTSPVYFKVENTVYLEEFKTTVNALVLKAYSDYSCTSSYIQLNNGNYVTDYVLIKI